MKPEQQLREEFDEIVGKIILQTFPTRDQKKKQSKVSEDNLFNWVQQQIAEAYDKGRSDGAEYRDDFI